MVRAAACIALLITVTALPADERPQGKDVPFLAPQRPLVLRFAVEIDGKDLSEVWPGFLDAQFKSLDRDGNGQLDTEERKSLLRPEVLAALGLISTPEVPSSEMSACRWVCPEAFETD